MKTLIIGYGNPGRQDDGLGPALAQRLQALKLADVSIDIDYQLNIEHGEDISHFNRVIFIDAHIDLDKPFSFTPVRAQPSAGFSTHSVSPGTVVHLAKALFNATPDCHILAIRGYEFDQIKEGLSPKAEENLKAAQKFLSDFLNPARIENKIDNFTDAIP